MKFRVGGLGSKFLSGNFLFFSLWTVVLILALILQAFPVFLIVMMFGLAVGVPKGAALVVIPLAFIAMLYLSCLIASKLAKRPAAGSGTGSADPGVRNG